jgi:SAM-dependent methyltransferase
MKKENISILDHENFLRNEIFFTEKKWPHFNLIFNDLKKLSKEMKANSKIISFERNNLYGGVSLFGPFFNKQNFISVDCISPKLKKRGSYNKIDKLSKIIVKKKNYQFDYRKIKLKKNLADLIIIPNLMHHIEEIETLFKQVRSILKKNGKVYIFEPLVRELHQVPEDYYRITPYGFKILLSKYNFSNFRVKYEGGPFTAIGYCWDQAIQFLPKSLRDKKMRWLNKEMKNFIQLDKKYKKNKVRKNTIFPMSFSLEAKLTKK